jgi:hypothetical protein
MLRILIDSKDNYEKVQYMARDVRFVTQISKKGVLNVTNPTSRPIY